MHQDIVAQLRHGDHSAFKQVFDKWHKKLYAYFLGKTRDEDAAKDLSQQTFIKFWESRKSLSDDYTVEIQLFNKARFIYIDWLRKMSNHRRLLSEQADPTLRADHDSYLQFDLKEGIMKAIATLPEMRGKVFRLKHQDGYSYKEIAEQLGISVKTVDNHLLQATRQMKKIISSLLTLVLCLPYIS